jgi:hypothetical protein
LDSPSSRRGISSTSRPAGWPERSDTLDGGGGGGPRRSPGDDKFGWLGRATATARRRARRLHFQRPPAPSAPAQPSARSQERMKTRPRTPPPVASRRDMHPLEDILASGAAARRAIALAIDGQPLSYPFSANARGSEATDAFVRLQSGRDGARQTREAWLDSSGRPARSSAIRTAHAGPFKGGNAGCYGGILRRSCGKASSSP